MTNKQKAVTAIVAVGIIAALGGGYSYLKPASHVVIATWNVRGYPEKQAADRQWFTATVNALHPDVMCVQEIANQSKVDTFLKTETRFISAAFQDSDDGQDNAIFATTRVTMQDMPDPDGFQHPAQIAYIAYKGFDAVLVTVHLSWTDTARREEEKVLLQNIVTQSLRKDPDVIICGDFNTTEQDIEDLAQALGMVVMVPAGQDGMGTTWAGNRYDHFLISPDLASEEAVACQIWACPPADQETAEQVSDHRPVLAVFSAAAKYRDRN